MKLETEKNKILHVIKGKIKTIIALQKIIAKNTHNSTKMFKIVKMLNRQKLGNQYIHDKESKPLLNPQDIYEARNDTSRIISTVTTFQNYSHSKDTKDISTCPSF